MNGLRRTIGIKYGFHELTQTSAVSEHSNKTGHYPLWNEVFSLLTETLTGTLVELMRLFT